MIWNRSGTMAIRLCAASYVGVIQNMPGPKTPGPLKPNEGRNVARITLRPHSEAGIPISGCIDHRTVPPSWHSVSISHVDR